MIFIFHIEFKTTSCKIVILDNFDHTFQKNGYMAGLVLTSHKVRYFM